MNKRKEKILILLSDFVTINLGFIVFFLLRVQSGWFAVIIMPEFIATMFAVYFYWLIIFSFVGMYRTWFAQSRFDEISTLFKSSFVGIFALFFLIFFDDYVHNVDSSSRILIFIYWGLFLFFTGTGRLLVRSFQRSLLIKGHGRRNGIIIGFNEKGFEAYNEINTHRALGIDIIGILAVTEESLEKSYKNIRVLDKIDNILTVIREQNIQEVIIALEKGDHDILTDIISKLGSEKVGIKIIPDLYEILSGQARTTQIYSTPLIDIMPQLMPEWEKKLKRVFDVAVSLIILVVMSPVIFITAIAIKLNSNGPVFFKQERCGLDGEIFRMIKFRSMYNNAEMLTGPVWSQKGDTRITGVGRLIRKVRIDELPQLINVLKGEMSLVGPRPERPFFVEKLAQEIPYYKRRLKVRPGLTGWAQIKHKYDETIDDVKVKLRYDLFYIENMSLRMDFKILSGTILVVMFGKGHY